MKHHWIVRLSLFLVALSLRADETTLNSQHATAVGESVLRLLEVRDAEGFANAMAITNQHNRSQVLNSARLVLDQAARSGLNLPVHFRVKEVLAKATGKSSESGHQGVADFIRDENHPAGRPLRDSQADKLPAGRI
jgi:hypothetical protein